MKRRIFIKSSSKAVLASTILPVSSSILFQSSKVDGANERVNLALIGCGDRGEYVARGFIDDGASILHVCDPHEERMKKYANLFSGLQGKRPLLTKDFRVVLDDKDVDAVIIATPHHWHALPTINAVQAGKDVYLEKPQSHAIWEGRQMIKAAKKYNKIVQIGAQNRSAPYIHAAKEYIASGKLGEIHLVKVYNLKSNAPFHDRGKPFNIGNPLVPPKSLDWDLWLGSAPVRPYYPTIFNNNGWEAFWDFSVGDMDDALHQIDIALFLMGEPIPLSVSSSGGRFHYKNDDAETPDIMVSSIEFNNFIMTLEMSAYPMYMQKTTATIRRNDEFPYWTQNATRIELYGSKELMIVGRMGGGWITMTSGGKIVDKMYGRYPDDVHRKDFLDCLRTRNRPNGDIEIVNNSMNTAHISNISHRIGNQKLKYNAHAEQFIDNTEANKYLKKNYRDKYKVPEIV
jgi:predicted dehydrogenase